MGKVVVCQHCHGRGKVTEWDSKKKTYVDRKCGACGGSGKINLGTI